VCSHGELSTDCSPARAAVRLRCVQDVNHLLKQAKVDDNGKVNYADFIKIILK
jgi:hypothetical protein